MNRMEVWRQELGRDDLVHGQFGENLTLEGEAKAGDTIAGRPRDSRYASPFELAEAWSVPTRWSCRTGVCH